MIAKAKEKKVRIIAPQEGKQADFLSTEADIAIYGGAAGGGKTMALLMDPLRHVTIDRFTAGIFRRTSTEINDPGGPWDTTFQIYPYAGGQPVQSRLKWKFKKCSISFRHLEHVSELPSMGGSQYCGIYFDELTTFEEEMFWFMLSRNRSICGVKPYIRATCNPEPDSWVSRLLEWWIDQDSGDPIEERSGVLRWMLRRGNDIEWGDSREEVVERNREFLMEQIELSASGTKARASDFVKSFTFIPARIGDNKILIEQNPEYLGNLISLPEAERNRLLRGNWKRVTKGLIDEDKLQWYSIKGDSYMIGKQDYHIGLCKRFATIDTAGGKDRIDSDKTKSRSYSTCGIWDSHRSGDGSMLFLRDMFHEQMEFTEMRERIPAFLSKHNCRVVVIEDATTGAALASEFRKLGLTVEMVPTRLPKQREGSETRGAKYERAIAAGLFQLIENRCLCLPVDRPKWVRDYLDEVLAWRGMAKDRADQIDVTSYAAYRCRSNVARWEQIGTVPLGRVGALL